MARRIGEFTVFKTVNEFRDYVGQSTFSRRITIVQNHHTFRPSYRDFSDVRKNYLSLLQGMERSHINDRGWNQIGQNITTFPDGAIALCRPIDTKPAGIFGANTGAICLEHLGYFDQGEDTMTPAHQESIIQCNAILCRKFQLPVTTQHVVYHHWHDANGKRFPASFIDANTVNAKKLQKTCPGTAFFNGNRVIDAVTHFLPFVQAALNQPGVPITPGAAPAAPVPPPSSVPRTVNTATLNVRAGRGTTFSIIRQLPINTAVNVYLTVNGWSKIDPLREEWVASRYLR